MLKKLALLIVSMVFSVLLIELLLRIVPDLFFLSHPRGILENNVHPIYGWKNKPSSRYRWNQEGKSAGWINSKGWRDREYDVNKREGVFRVLILGDSFVEALQVNLESTFHKLLEARLNQDCGDHAFEVVAMGKSGYGTGQELLVYIHEGREYNPDLVILMFCANDYVDNSRRLASRDGTRPLGDRSRVKPYYHLEAGRLVLDDSFRFGAAYQEQERSKSSSQKLLIDNMVRGVFWRLRAGEFDVRNLYATDLQSGSSTPYTINTDIGTPRLDDIGHEFQLFVRPMLPIWEEEVELTDSLIVELSEQADSDGHEFLLVSIPFNFAVHEAELFSQFEAQFDHMTLDVHQPQALLEALASANGIRYFSLLDSFREHYAKTGISPFGFGLQHGRGHFNQYGHRVVAEGLFSALAASRADLSCTR